MDVDIIFCSSQLIHVLVIPRNAKPFYCSFVYGANDKKERQTLFQYIQNVSCNIDKPWLIGGDFNCVAHINERLGSVVRIAETLPLRTCMMQCSIFDLKSYGHFFTWNNKQAGLKRVYSKIDRVMGNQLWEDSFFYC